MQIQINNHWKEYISVKRHPVRIPATKPFTFIELLKAPMIDVPV